jgi:hypothetical protein
MRMHFPAYLVRSSKDPTVLTAEGVFVSEDGDISWLDQGDHERAFTIGRIIEDDDARFTFVRAADEGGGTYTLEELTPERYAALVEPRLTKAEEVE